jgi:kynureninase
MADLFEGKDINDIRTAESLDAQDTLAGLRQEFAIPTRGDVAGEKTVEGKKRTPCNHDSFDTLLYHLANEAYLQEPCTYLCGNSLGLMPKQTRALVNEEFDAWSRR